ncbi:MAG: amidohydrolase family protein [Sphaerochaetaceae bacterium]
MKAITNTTIVKTDHMVPDGIIVVENDTIVAMGPSKAVNIPADAEIFDAKGLYAGPGLIDIHTHAGGDYWFHEHPKPAAELHLQHGTTSLLPALYFNLDATEYIDSIRKLRSFSKEDPAGRIIKGLYMEGPYLNPKFGADQENKKWKGPLEPAVYSKLIDEAGSFAKVWCVAPEREHIIEFIEDVKKKIPGIVFSVAHSEASPQQIEACIPFGLHLATHHTNATGNLDKYPECRGVCVDETVNYHDDIYAELICDSMGIHVDPFMLRLVLKIKGKTKIILISDACSFYGPTPPGYDGVTDINFDFDGQIAGSKLTLDVACKNMMKHTGSSLSDVFRFASHNPAQLLGMEDYGELAVGKHADIVLVDEHMHVGSVMLDGNMIKHNT